MIYQLIVSSHNLLDPRKFFVLKMQLTYIVEQLLSPGM